MIGLVVAAHADLAGELLRTAEMIIGPLPRVATIGICREDSPEEVRARFAKAVAEAGQDGQGVLILTDMFGGTPSNIGYAFLEPQRVEVLTGVNLAMLLKAASERSSQSLAQLAVTTKEYGQQSILLASEILTRLS